MNGLSDHETQIIKIENIFLTKLINSITTKREITNQIILQFQLILSHENWEDNFMDDDAKTSFNKFWNIILKDFSCIIYQETF